ncbi:hypothetical protein JCM16303_000974 [Sporobolomyces ruberrimus]
MFKLESQPFVQKLAEIVDLLGSTVWATHWQNDIKGIVEATWRSTPVERIALTRFREAELARELERIERKLYRMNRAPAASSAHLDTRANSDEAFFSGCIAPVEQLVGNFGSGGDIALYDICFRNRVATHNLTVTPRKDATTVIHTAGVVRQIVKVIRAIKDKAQGYNSRRWARGGVPIDFSRFNDACEEYEELCTELSHAQRDYGRLVLMYDLLRTIKENLTKVIEAHIVDAHYWFLWIPTRYWLRRNVIDRPQSNETVATRPLSQVEQATSLSHPVVPLGSLRRNTIYGI